MAGQNKRLLGGAIRTVRQRLGLSLRELAARAKTTPAAVSHIERGFRKPSSDMLARLAGAMDCSVDELLRGVVPATKPSVHLSRIISAMKDLPPSAQEQVADFCDFLRQRRKRK